MSERVNPYLRIEDTTWPDPSDPNETGYRLRYGGATKADLMWAASVIDAYAHLVSMTAKDRQRRVRQILRAHPEREEG